MSDVPSSARRESRPIYVSPLRRSQYQIRASDASSRRWTGRHLNVDFVGPNANGRGRMLRAPLPTTTSRQSRRPDDLRNLLNKRRLEKSRGRRALEREKDPTALLQSDRRVVSLPRSCSCNTTAVTSTNTSTTDSYCSYPPTLQPLLTYDNLHHIIELSGFAAASTDWQRQRLESELRALVKTGFTTKWVDDTHCLVVFDSHAAASRASHTVNGGSVLAVTTVSAAAKARPVEEASVAAKCKIANSPGDWSLPYRKRIRVDIAAANRMISSHLGLFLPGNSTNTPTSYGAVATDRRSDARTESTQQTKKSE